MKKILLVEDDVGSKFVLERRLKKEGYEVISAETVKDAIDMAERESPDLILLDIILPERGGMEIDMEGGYKVAERLKDKDILFIFTSVYESEEDISRGMRLGARDFFTKPFSTRALLERIEEILGE